MVLAVVSSCTAEKADANTGARDSPKTNSVIAAGGGTKPAEPTPEKPILVYDGRAAEKGEPKVSPSEEALVEKAFESSEKLILEKSKFECDEGTEKGVSIVGVASGSFTKPGSLQKAFLYERCRAGRSFGIGGIVVFEKDSVAAHYSYGENGLESGMLSLPDINKNGLSEIVLVGGGMGQGYVTHSISLIEIEGQNLAFLGGTSVYNDNSGAMEDESKIETEALTISVAPGEKPRFFRETYNQKPNSTQWSLTKKSEAFTLEKGEPGKMFKVK